MKRHYGLCSRLDYQWRAHDRPPIVLYLQFAFGRAIGEIAQHTVTAAAARHTRVERSDRDIICRSADLMDLDLALRMRLLQNLRSRSTIGENIDRRRSPCVE